VKDLAETVIMFGAHRLTFGAVRLPSDSTRMEERIMEKVWFDDWVHPLVLCSYASILRNISWSMATLIAIIQLVCK